MVQISAWCRRCCTASCSGALSGWAICWSACNPAPRWPPAPCLAAVTDVLQQAFDEAPGTQKIAPEQKERLGDRHVRDIKLSRLRDAYFDREVATNWLSLAVDRGASAVVAGLVAVAFLILALAAVNYVNLATIRVIRRQREIAMRK